MKNFSEQCKNWENKIKTLTVVNRLKNNQEFSKKNLIERSFYRFQNCKKLNYKGNKIENYKGNKIENYKGNKIENCKGNKMENYGELNREL